MYVQWHILRFFWNTIFSRKFQDNSPKGYNHESWRIIFSYKHVWMAWIGVIYFGKCNYSVLIKCIRHCVRRKFIQNHFKIFSLLLILDKNLGSHTSWLVAKLLQYNKDVKLFAPNWISKQSTMFGNTKQLSK